jgi:hypothetical protein
MSGYSAELAVILVRDFFGPTTAVSFVETELISERGGRIVQEWTIAVTGDMSSSTAIRTYCLGCTHCAGSTWTRPLGNY